jgi:hypothetical protein
MEVEFSDVISSGTHVHCYLDRYYVARLTQERDRWDIEICNRPCGSAPTRAEAEEVVRMWARVQSKCNTLPCVANPSQSGPAQSE